jgi:SpoVK/Ycf46/Vps4 family AAA+-type ATPase
MLAPSPEFIVEARAFERRKSIQMECAIKDSLPLTAQLASEEYLPQLHEWFASYLQNAGNANEIVPKAILPSVADSIRLTPTECRFYLFKWALNYEMDSIGDTEEQEQEEANLPLFSSMNLPNASFDAFWSSLWMEEAVKMDSLSFIKTAIHLSGKKLSKSKFLLNKTLLFYGPPGTGKTTLCKALAQQVSKQLYFLFGGVSLFEINAASIYSKYYSESGKVVQKMFADFAKEAAKDRSRLFFLLLDEVESLAAERERAIGSGEPTDSVRAVNSLLTQLDKLVASENIFVLATSNVLSCIDSAFVDRMDLVVRVNAPSVEQIYCILRESLQELIQNGLISGGIVPLLPVDCIQSELLVEDNENSKRILFLASKLHQQEASGRKVRKFCLLIYAKLTKGNVFGENRVTLEEFTQAMISE